MKILHIGIGDKLGGIETFLYKIASNTDLSKYQMDFMVFNDVVPCFYNELTDLGCKFHRVSSRMKNIIRFCKDLDALLKSERYDVVHFHVITLSWVEPIFIALKNNAKVIVHSHSGSFIGSLHSKIMHKINKIIVPYNKICKVAVSGLAGGWMFGETNNIHILNNGIDTNKVRFCENARKSIRKEFCLQNERLVAHVGRFDKAKNQNFVIDIFAELHKFNPKTKLMLVGDGDLRKETEKKAEMLGLKNDIIFTGLRSDIPDILSAADVFLFPSFYEGFPIALIEAEATGLYCIASDTITREVGIDGLCEYVSLEKSAKEWAQIVNNAKIIQNREECVNKIRESGLDVENDIKRLTDIYNDVCR